MNLEYRARPGHEGVRESHSLRCDRYGRPGRSSRVHVGARQRGEMLILAKRGAPKRVLETRDLNELVRESQTQRGR